MTIHIDIQHASKTDCPIEDAMITNWAEAALKSEQNTGELTLRLVDVDEITDLNHQYRQQQKPTNVLAFPSHLPPNVSLDCPLLGDVVLCPSVLEQESMAGNLPLQAHWAHIIIHGVLHLLGFDHMNPKDAHLMETREIALLSKFGFDNPYTEDHHVE